MSTPTLPYLWPHFQRNRSSGAKGSRIYYRLLHLLVLWSDLLHLLPSLPCHLDLKQRRRRRQGRRLEKMHLCFTVEFRTCLDLFSTSIGLRTCSSLICNASVQFQTKIRKISRRRSRSPKYPELGHFTLSFYRGRLRNVPRIITHVYSYCSAH